MKKSYFLIPLIGISFTACELTDALGLAVENFDEILIYNDIDVSDCKSLIPSSTSSAIEYESSTRTCEDYGRTDGNHCYAYYYSTTNSGDTTCIIGYDN